METDYFEIAKQITRAEGERVLRSHDLEFEGRARDFAYWCRAHGFIKTANAVEEIFKEERK